MHIFFPLILNPHYIFKIKTCKMAKLLFAYKPRAAWLFSFCFFLLFHHGMPCWFQSFLTFILYPIANSVCLLLDRWDVGYEPFPAGAHLALKRRLSPADINSGMLEGIPFQKSSVMLEMLVAINTGCIFMMKSWEVQNFKTHSDPKCDCGCRHETKLVTWILQN